METIDVVIPVWRPDRRLWTCIEKLREQVFPVRSITLILSVDEPQEEWVREVEKIGRFSGIQIEKVKKAAFNHGGVRHDWARRSDADVLLFMVQDAIPADRHLTKRLMEALQDEQAAVAYARHLPDGRCDAIEEYARYYTYPPRSRRKTWEDMERQGVFGCFTSNACAAYRRNWYEKTGGFERRILLSEDSVFAAKALRLAAVVVYCSEAKVIHAHNFSFLTQWKRNFDIGVVHKKYEDIFGRLHSEKAGSGLMTGTALYLIRRGKIQLFPKLFCIGCIKVLAYQSGKHYELLPKGLVKKWSLNKEYWEEEKWAKREKKNKR